MQNLVYEFVYHSKRRIVVVTSEETQFIKGWDFTVGDFRQFTKTQINGLKLVMSNVIVEEYDSKQKQAYENIGGSVFVNNNIMYIVKLGV